jgi:hypothetical protein
MLTNKTEISDRGSKPVEVDHTFDFGARIRSRLEEIAPCDCLLRARAHYNRSRQSTSPQKAWPGAVLAGRIKERVGANRAPAAA